MAGQPLSKRSIVQGIVDQHVADAAAIYNLRTALCAAPHVSLRHLHRFDIRVAANLDGLTEAGASGRKIAQAALANPSPAALFVATVCAIDERDSDGFERLIAVAASLPHIGCGLRSALAWIPLPTVRDLLPPLLESSHPAYRLAGIAACAMHRLGRDNVIFTSAFDSAPLVVARTLKWAGEVAASEYIAAFPSSPHANDRDCAYWAAWGAVLLGNRGRALSMLHGFVADGPRTIPALRLVAQVSDASELSALISTISGRAKARMAITAVGVLGSSEHVDWLFSQMGTDETARLAGEAFSLITGIDLALLDLDRKPPENFQAGPNGDPNDPNVDMDQDDGLPWPDVKKVEAWWHTNQARFQRGTRYFMGQPVNKEHCIHVLKTGYQRQRILAAQYLCLLEPGTPLFNTSAPAWRQQRLLAAM